MAYEQLKNILEANGDITKCEKLGISPVFCSSNELGFSKILPPEARLAIMFGSILISYLLLALDWREANKIIKSRDISYAFTSTIAYRYYVIQSYPHYCFFDVIRDHQRTIDVLAFYCFFAFKGMF